MILSCNIFHADNKGKPWTRLLRQNEKKPRKPQSSPRVKNTFELPPLLVGMKTQNPGNYRPIKEMLMACLVIFWTFTSSEVSKINVWLSSFKMYHQINFFVRIRKQLQFRKNQRIEVTSLRMSNRPNRKRLGNFCS